LAQTSYNGPFYKLLVLLVLASLLSGCAGTAAGMPQAVSTVAPQVDNQPPASTPEERPTAQPTAAATPAVPAAPVQPKVWLSPALPVAFVDQINLPANWQQVSDHDDANLWVEIPKLPEYTISGIVDEAADTHWVYALVAPFPTVMDQAGLKIIQETWKGNLAHAPGRQPLLMTAETKTVFESAWGPANRKGVQTVEPGELLDTAWAAQASWAIIPFESIEPRWKVLRVDGQSPLESGFDTETYPLSIPIIVSGQDNSAALIPDPMPLPTNRDPQKLTVLVMTGVTALSRHIGERMESKGVTYPASDIGSWLADADLTHISNEVSFYQDCPKPGPERADMRFCSNPKYIELLEAVGADIIELTGNHNLDWGPQPFLDTLEMYRQRGWGTYGGGANLEESKTPLYVEHNGNRLVFLGCSPAGPEPVWATEYTPGSAPCNMSRLEDQVSKLRGEGYLPIVTFQAVETDTYQPTPAQGAPDFRRMARAGAIIVSGSQSHVPQTMTFVPDQAGDDGFVHYGLGNLFFDQMEPEIARQQFIDRHVIYDGRYLGVELLTALLEDSARPRPMTTAEREEFLQTIFSLSQWSEN